MSIDAKIRDVQETSEGYVLYLEPRFSKRDCSWSVPGQRTLTIKNPTWKPEANMEIWGSDTVTIETSEGPRFYLRPSYTWLKEWFKPKEATAQS